MEGSAVRFRSRTSEPEVSSRFIGGLSDGPRLAVRWMNMGACEIATGNGEEHSVWPTGSLPTVQVSAEPRKLVEANGHEVTHYGSNTVVVRAVRMS